MKKEGFRLWFTGLWLVAGPVLFCMWLAAVNYANNLVYAVLYLIVALTCISIFHAWRNVTHLQVDHIRIHPAFAVEEVRITVYLRNLSKHAIYGLQFARVEEEFVFRRRLTPLRSQARGGVRIAAGDSCAAELSFHSERRGVYRFEALHLRSAYPFGLFWASVVVPVNTEYYIYPQPRGTDELPALRAGHESGAPSSNRPGDDFAGVRAYIPGESLRHVDWKAFARGRPLSIKQFTGGAGHELWLDADQMARMPLEARLSQLALWIVTAERAEIPYALRLGRTVLPLGLGETHARRALEALAVAGVGAEK